MLTALILFPPGRKRFGFMSLPVHYFLVVGAIVSSYLALAEIAKALSCCWIEPVGPVSIALRHPVRRVHRIRTRWWDSRRED